MKNTTVNMTEGEPIRLLIRFSIPMLIGNIFQQLYNLADSIIVGQLIGADALAAIGTTGSISFFFFAICNGIGSGGGIITSQYFGQGDTSKVKNCIVNTGYIMVVFPIIVGTIAFVLAEPFLILLETPESILKDSTDYLKITCIGLLFVSIYNYISSMLRALGDSKTPLYFLVFACILNIILDIICVYSFGWGVVGAGIATIFSQLVSGALCIAFALKKNPYFKFTRYNFKINRIIIMQTIKLGVPLSLQYSLIAISCMALQRIVNAFGPIAVAAFTATNRIEQLLHQPYQTLSAALSTYGGQNYGAKKNDRIILGYKKSMMLMAIFTSCMIPLLCLFGRQITAIFVNDEAVIDMGATGLRISSFFYIFLGIIYVVRGALNSVGDAFFALLNGIVEVIGRFTVPVFLTVIPGIGLWGIWWSVGIVWFMSGFSAWLRYLVIKKRILHPAAINVEQPSFAIQHKAGTPCT